MHPNGSTRRKREYPVRPIAERFWPKVEPNNDPDACLIWRGCRQGQGYGMIWSGPPRNTHLLATHVAVTLAGGDVPPGSCVMHTCDNPPCVNVRHLVVADKATNNRDMWAKGRSNWQAPAFEPARGEAIGTSKLTADTVSAIRRRYAAGGVTLQALADEYGCSLSAVHQIIHRVRWAHIP